jgi:hypothetical protein
MTVSTIKMTARQYLELGQDPPGVRLELVDGEVAYHLKGGKYVGRVRASGSDTVQLLPFGKLQIPLGKLWRPKR